MNKYENPSAPEGAEKPGEPEQELSVEGLQKSADALRLKVAAAQAQRDKDIEQKLLDRETLIGEAKTTNETLRTAEETLEYFTAMQELGELKDPADVKKLAEIRGLVEGLEKQRLEIDKKIGAMEKEPMILGKLYDAAKKEDVERTAQKEYTRAREELDPRIDQLMKSIREFTEKENLLHEQRDKLQREIDSARKKVEKAFASAKDILGKKPDFGYILDRIFRENYSTEGIKGQLAEARKDLGWFDGKEKAAIDFLLSKDRERGELHQYRLSMAAADKLNRELEAALVEERALAEQYKAIILDGWRAQDKINELTGRKNAYELPSSLNSRADDHMRKIADIKHWKNGKEIYGKYEGWHTANQDPKNRRLSNTWDSVERMAGGASLIYSHPKEPEEQK